MALTGFLLKPSGRVRGKVLLLHGFSASPHEVRELGLHLRGKGHLVYAPRIAGHGQGRKAFDAAGMQQWMASAEEAFARMGRLAGKPLVLIGHSAGGVLATLLAAAHPQEISGLILGAPAFRLVDPTAPLSLIPLVRFFKPSMHFDSPHPDSKFWTLDYATSRIAELMRLGRLGAKAAQTLKTPLLMLQAKGDDLVSCGFNEKIFKKIPSPDKRLIVYEAGEHNVFHHYNPMQKNVFEWVDAFVRKITGSLP